MIIIKIKIESIEINNEIVQFQKPERDITLIELQTVTSINSDIENYYYYQGDEPTIN